MTTKERPEIRKTQILEAALTLAASHGYNRISRAQIGKAAGLSESMLSLYFGTMVEFRRTLMRYAVKQSNVKVVLQGLTDGNAHAKKAPPELKKKALALLT